MRLEDLTIAELLRQDLGELPRLRVTKQTDYQDSEST